MAGITGQSRWIVEGVSSEHVGFVWDDAWPLLAKAAARAVIPYTEGEMLGGLADSELQLWIAWDRDTDSLAGCAVSCVVLQDDMKILDVTHCGGRDFMRGWGRMIWDLLQDFGRANGCTHVAIEGRRGWIRFCGLTEVGKTKTGLPVMMKPLRD